MVNFMLNNLRCPSCEGFDTGLEGAVLPLNLDGMIPRRDAGAVQRKAALLSLIFTGFLNYFGIEHFDKNAVVAEYDNALLDTNHIGGQPDAARLVGLQGIQ